MTKPFFSRAGRAGPADMSTRIPELAPLRHKTVALFGLGALGAPVALELARAGLQELRILDCDIVDPATTVRWPIGLSAAGLPKHAVLAETIRRNYPFTRVAEFCHRLGSMPSEESDSPNEGEIIHQMTAAASAILDATAEVGVQHMLSDLALELGVPFVCVEGRFGAWGGSICRIEPGRTKGCWMCYRAACLDESISPPAADPNGEIQPVGCADPTFTGSSFDLGLIALSAVRTLVSTVCGTARDGYPGTEWDVITVSLRGATGEFCLPVFRGYTLTQHPDCPRCGS